MAEEQDQSERTEDPTDKKLDDALKRGDVAKSQEVSAWFVLTGATLVILIFSGTMTGNLSDTFKGLFANLDQIPMDGYGLRDVFVRVTLAGLTALGLPLLVLVIAALAGNMIQHRLVWSYDPITPKASKISPLAGFKRLFSAQSLINFVKGLAKLVIVSGVMFAIAWPQRDRLDTMMTMGPDMLMATVREMALKLLTGVIAVMTVVAVLDYAWQRHSWYKRQRMSMKEIKDEYKQAEGDPMVRAKIRQVRAERSRRRMIAQVPDATVVVTNPTHYAVALKYEPGMAAPVCVAKGIDAVALNIRSVAEANDVPVIENPPLARSLHAAVEVDATIDPDHYKAVAEIIGYVMQKRAKSGWRSNQTMMR